MLVDSHCHLNFPELSANLDGLQQEMSLNNVDYALTIATSPTNIPDVIAIATQYDNLFASVGIHPDEKLPEFKLEPQFLLDFAKHPKVVAIGETGLDYYWNKDPDMSWQHERFQTHIDVAKQTKLPLVVHNRDAATDVYNMLKTSGIDDCGAVIHCFTEDVSWAEKFLDIGCYISLSGIVTFKNAHQLHEVAKYVPLERLLVETDSPYLAPVPHRGKTNQPAYVRHTAQFIADMRQTSLSEIATATTDNFFRLFSMAKR